jgi:membrane associated rhomboid family serine protease
MMPLTKVVKWLIIINVISYLLLQVILEGMVLSEPWFTTHLGLVPALVVERFFAWQPLTYMFLHASNPLHIVFNMLMLWFMGSELEKRWGTRFFSFYYLGSGVGAAVIYTAVIVIYTLITGKVQPMMTPVVGASGALFGLMVAYGILFGDRIVHFMMLFPMPAKYFVLILAGMELLFVLQGGVAGTGVANVAHLGGALVGFLILWGVTQWQRKSRLRAQKSKFEIRTRNAGGLRVVVDNSKAENEKGNKDRDPKFWN